MPEKWDEEITLKEVLFKVKGLVQYLRTKWVVIIFFGLIGGGIGLIKVIYTKPIYFATLSFALEEEKGGGMGGAMGLASQLGIDLGGNAGGAFSSANLLELMRSRTLVEKTLLTPVTLNNKIQTLAELYLELTELRDAWKKDPRLSTVVFLPAAERNKFSLLQDSVLGVIYKNIISDNLSVGQKDKKTSINVVEVKSTNELFSKYFAETLAITVSDFYVESKTKKSMQNVALLQKQVDSIRFELNQALNGVAVLNDNIFGLNPAMSAKRVSPTKKQIDVQANTAILTQLVQNLEMAKMSLMRETPLIQIIDKPILPLRFEKESKRNGLVLGGFIGGGICILIFLILQLWKRMNQ